MRSTAAEDRAHLRLAGVEVAAAVGDRRGKAGREYALPQLGEIIGPGDLAGELEHLALIGREHRFEIDLVLRRRAVRHLSQHLAPVAVRHEIELVEGREEVQANIGVGGARRKVSRRERVDRVTAEHEIRQRARRGKASGFGRARRRFDRKRRAVDAVAVFHRVPDVAFRVHRAREVMMEVAAFGHPFEKMHQQWARRAQLCESGSRAC